MGTPNLVEKFRYLAGSRSYDGQWLNSDRQFSPTLYLPVSLERLSRVVQDPDEFEADQIRVSEHEVELQRMIDDMGFGDMGLSELNAIRGYSTPAINEFAD